MWFSTGPIFIKKRNDQPPGPRLNIKTVFPRYGYFHVKDKTVGETVVSLRTQETVAVDFSILSFIYFIILSFLIILTFSAVVDNNITFWFATIMMTNDKQWMNYDILEKKTDDFF